MKTSRFIRSAPHLPVKDLRATLEYHRDPLGFMNERTFGEKDGGIQRGEMRLRFAKDPSFTNDLTNEQHRLPLMWFVKNIEEVYAEFKARNISLADGLRTHPYGLKEFAFIDINGYYIRIAEEAGV